MAELLQQIYRDSDWKTDPTKQGERAAYYRSLAAKGLSPADDFMVRQQMAVELLAAGDAAGAVETYEGLRSEAAARQQPLSPEAAHHLSELLAIAYLRLGEQENCNHMHGQRACLFPIRGSGVHQLPRGAEGAVRELTRLLAQNPADLKSQWLLNVAYMQLGRYPSAVPKRWLLPETLFASERLGGESFPEFPESATAAGLDVTGHAGGAIMEDFDGDGWLDIMVTSSHPAEQMHLFHNNGDGTFADATAKAGLTGETGGLNLVLTDYNNDGHPDVLVLRGGWWGKQGAYPMSLLRNNGDGTFTDVTVRAGLLSAHPTQTAAWADFDGDGWLDLFVGHESSSEPGGDPAPSQLFHNNQDGTFTEMAGPSALAQLGFVKGVAWGDFNNDGRPDLYVSVRGGRNHLFRNDGPLPADLGHPLAGWRFTDVTAQAGVDRQRNSFATWFFDFDNDGWPDIYVGGYSTGSMADVGAFEAGKPFQAETPRLYRNNHDGTFSDVTAAVHLDRAILPMGANFGDLNDDGFLDIYLGTGESSYEAILPNRMFLNQAGSRFLDVTTAGGFGHLQKGHGVAFGDLRNTGHEDVFEEMGGALPGDAYQSALYRNPGNGNHSLTLQLQGVSTNRAAFGARIDVGVRGERGIRHIYRTVGYGSSFGGNPLRQHIGLGQAVEAESVTVSWPVSHRSQQLGRLAAGATYQVREDGTRAVLVKAYAPQAMTPVTASAGN